MDMRGYGIQTFRTDKGSQHASREIHDFLRTNGISHTTNGRAPHNQMNVAESMNRKLVEMTMS